MQLVQSRSAVEATPELYRVLNLPVRLWTPEQAAQCAAWMTQQLRTPHGQMQLRPIQALALWELYQTRGLFGIIRVGGGKTLVSLLAPLMVGAMRPVLIVPAKLRDKTKVDWRMLAQHWRVPLHVRIESYERLSHDRNNRILSSMCPDLIVADEAHKLRNERASVTRKVRRYMQANPHTMFACMSGTLTKRSLKDYSRLLRWALKPQNAPIPATENELEEWADALDEHILRVGFMHPGALLALADPTDLDSDPVPRARRGFHKRLVSTPGVIATTESKLDASLVISAIEPDLAVQSDQAIFLLRSTWETPDGWPISDPMTLWRHTRELALGFYYRWNPRPPDSWLIPRRTWAKECRETIASSRRYDSEGAVARAIVAGEIDSPAYWEWKSVENTFKPQTEIVWIDDSVLRVCAEWAREPGIIWTSHRLFAERLAALTGLSYYGRGGRDVAGRPIETASTDRAIIASIKSNSEGRNLQHWSRNLIVDPPPNGPQWEQLIARTHRDGQQADEVSFDLIMTCLVHYTGFWQAQKDAAYCQQTQGQIQKLSYATLALPTADEVMGRGGPRWSL